MEIRKPRTGQKATSYKIWKKNGTVIKKELVTVSTYRPIRGKYEIGTGAPEPTKAPPTTESPTTASDTEATTAPVTEAEGDTASNGSADSEAPSGEQGPS